MNIFDLLFTQPVFNLLVFLYGIIPGQDLGIAIILFTVIIRLALWPLVKKQLHQGKVMRDLQPQLAEIRKKTKGNQQLQAQMTMELYKEKGVNPFSSIGLLLVQIPFFIALYSAVQIITTSRGEVPEFTYSFLEGIPAITEIIKRPEQFDATFLGFIDLTQSAFSSVGLAALVLVAVAGATAALQFFQTKQLMPVPKDKKRLRDLLKEQAAGKQVDQADVMAAATRRTMYIIPVVILVASLVISGALALYIFASVATGYLQQQAVLGKDEEEMEDIAAAPVKPSARQKQAKKASSQSRAQQAKTAKVVKPPKQTKKKKQK